MYRPGQVTSWCRYSRIRREALTKAEDFGLDLVEVLAECRARLSARFIDYGKFKYEGAENAANEARKKQKTIEVKEIKFRPNIDRA